MPKHTKAGRPVDMPILPSIPFTRSEQTVTPSYGQEDRTITSGMWDLDIPKPSRYKFLSPSEWAILAHGVGGVKDVERHTPVHPNHWFWPPKGMPQGLYKDVVFNRTKSFYFFHAASISRWSPLILQLLIGATLTAVSHLSSQATTAVTVLGAANTVIAGLLAIMHNSGMPDRYRYDMAEFEALEDHLMKLLDTGIAPADMAVEQVLAECYDMYHIAKATVAANMPASYVPGRTLQARRYSHVATSPNPPGFLKAQVHGDSSAAESNK